MKILFVSHSAGEFGAEQSLLEIVAESVLSGHDVHVVVPAMGPIVARISSAGAAVHICHTRSWMGKNHNWAIGGVRLIQAMIAVNGHARLQAKLQPDLVVTNSAVVPSAAWAAKRLGINHLWIIRESILTNRALRSVLPKRVIVRLIYGNSTRLLVVSAFVQRQLEMLSRGSRAISVYPIRPRPTLADTGQTVDAQKLKPSSVSSGLEPQAADSRSFVLAPTVFVLPGQFTRDKGQLTAIAAAAEVARLGWPVKMILVGAGSKKATRSIHRLISELHVDRQVEVRPHAADMRALYAEADCVLMPSLNEAYGRTTAESLICGVPVVGFDAGATPEILGEGGGIMTSDLTPKGLARAMVQFLLMSPVQRQALASQAKSEGARIIARPSQYEYLMRATSGLVVGAT